MVILSNQQYEKIMRTLTICEKYLDFDDDIMKSYELKPEIYINEQIEYKDIAQIIEKTIEKIMERRNYANLVG